MSTNHPSIGKFRGLKKVQFYKDVYYEKPAARHNPTIKIKYISQRKC